MKFSPTQTDLEAYPILTRPDRRQDRFMFVFVVELSSFLLFVGVRISFHYYQNLPPDRNKNPRTEWKLPCSRSMTQAVSILELSKIWPCEPNFFGVAQSGLGIPDCPGCPAHLYLKSYLVQSKVYGAWGSPLGSLYFFFFFFFPINYSTSSNWSS